MAGLSPDILTHFTSSFNNLINILKHDFYPRYCYEEFTIMDNPAFVKNAFPMVCFCDIPLSQIKTHIKTYGKYGIALSKNWGILKRLNPVIYFNRDSLLSEEIYKQHIFLQSLQRISARIVAVPNVDKSEEYFNLVDLLPALGYSIQELTRYSKPYEGTLYRKGKLQKAGYRFYDEREWRYMPSIQSSSSNTRYWLNKSDFLDRRKLAIENKKIEDAGIKLTFDPYDIRYIIVKNEDDIIKLLFRLPKIKGKNYNPTVIKLLTSRIITCEQIINDF